MAKYILVKKVKGKKYEYQVIDVDSKAIVSKRTSAREYVACTADGSFYFGRLDLIGKGDHGKRLSHTAEILANPERHTKKWLLISRRIIVNNGLPRTPPNNGLPATLRAQQRKRKD